MGSWVSETYGHQEGSACIGHFGRTCYHPLFLFHQFGGPERVLLRRGSRGNARYWRALLPASERYRGLDVPSARRDISGRAEPVTAGATHSSSRRLLLGPRRRRG
jgi:hypothetical protein